MLKRKQLLVLHLVSPAGGVCSGFTPRTEEGGLLRHCDSRDEGDVLRELQSGSGYQYLLWRDGPDHSQCSQNLPGHHQEVSLFFPLNFRSLLYFIAFSPCAGLLFFPSGRGMTRPSAKPTTSFWKSWPSLLQLPEGRWSFVGL